MPGKVEQKTKSRNKLFSRLWNLWKDPDTFIFNSWVDAVFGFFAMIVLPAVSLFYVISGGGVLFSAYGFPIISLSLTALYDSYGRYCSIPQDCDVAIRNVIRAKIITRIVCHILVIALSLLVCESASLAGISWVPYVFLVVSGMIIVLEGFNRIKTSCLLFFGGV